ncbi:MAG: FAD-dependent oxidoreductase, partial [Pseudomonadota bacterium]
MEKVVVIGSGVGGLACGALLAQKGASVTVLESHPFIGGRCAAFTRDGFVCDFGVHMFSLGNLGPHGQAARRLGVDLPFVTRHPSCRVMGRADFDFPLDIKPLPRLALLAVRLGIKPSRLPGAWKLFRALLSGRIRPDMEDLTAREYVLRYSTDPAVHVFVNCLCQLYFAVDYLTVSAAEFALCFGRMFNESAFGYPAGGCKAIPDAFAKALYRAGGRILTNTRAVNIRVENNEVQGVETKDGFFPADRVISNAGIALTAGLAGESALGREFVERAGKL